MNNVLIGLGVLVVAALAALFAVPHFVDWNRYRGVFEEEASRIVGRDVRVSGPVNLRLLPAPYFSFEKVRIADSDTGSGQPFFRAESVTIWLSVAPLARGVVEASEIELKQPELRLHVLQLLVLYYCDKAEGLALLEAYAARPCHLPIHGEGKRRAPSPAAPILAQKSSTGM